MAVFDGTFTWNSKYGVSTACPHVDQENRVDAVEGDEPVEQTSTTLTLEKLNISCHKVSR